MVTLRWVVYRCWESQINQSPQRSCVLKEEGGQEQEPACTDRQTVFELQKSRQGSKSYSCPCDCKTDLDIECHCSCSDKWPYLIALRSPMFVWLERCLSCQSTGCSCRASGLGSQYPHGGSSSRWSDSLFCPHPALHTSGTYTYMDTNIQTYKIHNKSYKCSVEPHIIFYIFATKYLFYALIHSCRTDIPIVEKFTEMNRFGVWLILVWFYCWWYCFASIFIIIIY